MKNNMITQESVKPLQLVSEYCGRNELRDILLEGLNTQINRLRRSQLGEWERNHNCDVEAIESKIEELKSLKEGLDNWISDNCGSNDSFLVQFDIKVEAL